MKNHRKPRDTEWVNCARAIAMLAVIVNHTHGSLYQSEEIALASIFSVSTFVLLSGITSYCSVERHFGESMGKEWFRRIKSILIPYIVATFFYSVTMHRFFDFKTYLLHVIRFDASGPFYFVVFYIQLLLIAPILYNMIIALNKKKGKVLYYILIFWALVAFSALSIRFTFILDVWGGGKFLFGGTYLVLFYLGMLFAHANISFTKPIWKVCHMFLSGALIAVWWLIVRKYHFDIDAYFPFGEGINPPSISFIIYSLLVVWFLYSLFSLMKDCGRTVVRRIYEWIGMIGKYSLYIFLYHRLAKDYFLNHLPIPYIWVKRVVYFIVMVFGPIALKLIWDLSKKKYKIWEEQQKELE